ncbi:hypothetical protein IAT38_004657 [Cryptococcus sp. DSM 104549]
MSSDWFTNASPLSIRDRPAPPTGDEPTVITALSKFLFNEMVDQMLSTRFHPEIFADDPVAQHILAERQSKRSLFEDIVKTGGPLAMPASSSAESASAPSSQSSQSEQARPTTRPMFLGPTLSTAASVLRSHQPSLPEEDRLAALWSIQTSVLPTPTGMDVSLFSTHPALSNLKLTRENPPLRFASAAEASAQAAAKGEVSVLEALEAGEVESTVERLVRTGTDGLLNIPAEAEREFYKATDRSHLLRLQLMNTSYDLMNDWAGAVEETGWSIPKPCPELKDAWEDRDWTHVAQSVRPKLKGYAQRTLERAVRERGEKGLTGQGSLRRLGLRPQIDWGFEPLPGTRVEDVTNTTTGSEDGEGYCDSLEDGEVEEMDQGSLGDRISWQLTSGDGFFVWLDTQPEVVLASKLYSEAAEGVGTSDLLDDELY